MTLMIALNYSLQYLVPADRVILGSTHPDRHDVIGFLVERHDYLQHQAWKAQKTRHVALEDSISIAKHYRDTSILCLNWVSQHC